MRVDGVVRCWGANLGGELGHGSTETAGDEPGEMGINLPVTDLGEGSRAVRIASGGSHTCAILQDASLKCWGGGNQGQPRPRVCRKSKAVKMSSWRCVHVCTCDRHKHSEMLRRCGTHP